jgi:Rieske Fe-S protein
MTPHPEPSAPVSGEPSTPASGRRRSAPGPSRRVLLGAAAGVGAVGLLAACGGDDGDAAATGSPSASASGGASAAPSDSGSAGGDAAAALAKTADVPVGGGVVIAAQKVVVTQPTAGEFKAFSATCTHMACTVGSVSNGTINCPCHGSKFAVADGSVKQGPAGRPLPEVSVKVEGDSVVKA